MQEPTLSNKLESQDFCKYNLTLVQIINHDNCATYANSILQIKLL